MTANPLAVLIFCLFHCCNINIVFLKSEIWRIKNVTHASGLVQPTKTGTRDTRSRQKFHYDKTTSREKSTFPSALVTVSLLDITMSRQHRCGVGARRRRCSEIDNNSVMFDRKTGFSLFSLWSKLIDGLVLRREKSKYKSGFSFRYCAHCTRIIIKS